MDLRLAHTLFQPFDHDNIMAAYIAVLVIVLGVALLLWRLHRFTIYPALHPEEPSEFPYWIPCMSSDFRTKMSIHLLMATSCSFG